jgi:uncharacterized protein YlxW (UPF0749 family)
MKGMWEHKGIITLLAVLIVLAVGATGAVALTTGPGNDASAAAAGQLGAPATVQLGAATAAATQKGAAAAEAQTLRVRERIERLKDRLERLRERSERWQERIAALRAKMTPEDQAALDKLLQTAKDQQAALEKARGDLRGTLQQIKSLADKYRPQSTTSTTAPPTNQ